VSEKDFYTIVNGPLADVSPGLRMHRVVKALRAVIETTGEAGEAALREHVRAEHGWPPRPQRGV
jgi:DNA polymerase IIIc chi subunit